MPGTQMIPSQCINVSVHYFTSKKVKLLVGLLGKGSDVLPLRLWCHCGEHHAEGGRLTGYSAQMIEAACGWWGKAGEMVRAFQSLRLLDGEGSVWHVHDWDEWQGHINALKTRGRKNRQKQLEKMAGSPASSRTSSPALTERSGTDPPTPQGDVDPEDELDHEVRKFLSVHPKMLWSPKCHSDMRKLVTAGGWPAAKRLIAQAVKNRAGQPAAYALGILAHKQADDELAKPTATPVGMWAQKDYCPG